MKTYPIPQPLLQVIVNYLQTKPWAEVNGILAEIQQIAATIDSAALAALAKTKNGGGLEQSEQKSGI
jgi:hypothetical protein